MVEVTTILPSQLHNHFRQGEFVTQFLKDQLSSSSNSWCSCSQAKLHKPTVSNDSMLKSLFQHALLISKEERIMFLSKASGLIKLKLL